jgi:hypothetical protein
MWGDSGGTLVLLLIVRNFQHGSCEGIVFKFNVLLIFPFIGRDSLLEAVSGLRQAGTKCRNRPIAVLRSSHTANKADRNGKVL